MAHNEGTPRLLAKCGSAVEVLDRQQTEDPALARVKRARTTGHTDSLPAMAPHSSRQIRATRRAEHPDIGDSDGDRPGVASRPDRRAAAARPGRPARRALSARGEALLPSLAAHH